MPVYVDELRVALANASSGCFGRHVKKSCHLMADTKEELEAVRKKLKLRPGWRHSDHYDLVPDKRADAIRLGAIPVKAATLVDLRRRKRVAAEPTED